MKLKEVLHGSIGLTKVAAGMERASEETIKERLKICKECPHRYKEFSKLIQKEVYRCKICKCFINAKVLLKSEHCEDIPSRWSQEEE